MAESNSGTISANAKKRLGSQVSRKRRSAVTKRHARLRKKVQGTAERPRLAVDGDVDAGRDRDRHLANARHDSALPYQT